MTYKIEDIKTIIFGLDRREPTNLSFVLREAADWLDENNIAVIDIVATSDTEYGNWYVTVYFDDWCIDI